MKDIRFGEKAMVATLAVCLVLGVAGTVKAEDPDLTGLLEQVGQGYAEGYVSPLITALGINQNSGLYHTANIPKSKLTISFGLKVMAATIDDEDKTFSRTQRVRIRDFIDNPLIPTTAEADAVFSGPTVFGSEDDLGSVNFSYGGTDYSVDGITGLADVDYMPLATPEASVGGLFGLKATVRWLPDVDIGDYGKIKFLGYGLQYNFNSLLPLLPVDVMAGYFTQSLDVGDIMETEASSMYVAVSKSLPLLTVYGGYAIEDSSVDVSYDSDEFGEVAFSMDGAQESRVTVGATLSFLLKLNVEASFGDTADTYGAGLLFGF